jgi:putative transposase
MVDQPFYRFQVRRVPHRKNIFEPINLECYFEPCPVLPDQQTFQQYLRELARGAIRVVVEDVMREELDALIGVGWGACSLKRKGYRNGHYSRDLVTSSGRLEDRKRAPRPGRSLPHAGV